MVKQTADLQKMLDDLNAKLVAANKDLDATLAATKLAAAKAETDLTAVKTKSAEELATARAQMKDLLKKVDDANASIIDLQGDKQKIADKFDKFQKETETRFAGIVMSGKRLCVPGGYFREHGEKGCRNGRPDQVAHCDGYGYQGDAKYPGVGEVSGDHLLKFGQVVVRQRRMVGLHRVEIH